MCSLFILVIHVCVFDRTASPVHFLKFSPGGEFFATAGQVRVHEQSSEIYIEVCTEKFKMRFTCVLTFCLVFNEACE